MDNEDPEARIAELERQISDVKAARTGPANSPGAEISKRQRELEGGSSVDSRLAEPPRRIPAVFWLAELLGFRGGTSWCSWLSGLDPSHSG